MDSATVPHARFWQAMYWSLLAAWLGAAALDMMRVHAGFITNHLADVTLPAWLYVTSRGLVPTRRAGAWVTRIAGRTPTRAAVLIFLASTLTEISQRYWPNGPFRGRWDPLDVVAYGVGVGICYVLEVWLALPREVALPHGG